MNTPTKNQLNDFKEQKAINEKAIVEEMYRTIPEVKNFLDKKGLDWTSEGFKAKTSTKDQLNDFNELAIVTEMFRTIPAVTELVRKKGLILAREGFKAKTL